MMVKQDTTIDAPAHTPGTAKGEELAKGRTKEPTRTASDATTINPKNREPIDPRMPKMPPA